MRARLADGLGMRLIHWLSRSVSIGQVIKIAESACADSGNNDTFIIIGVRILLIKVRENVSCVSF